MGRSGQQSLELQLHDASTASEQMARHRLSSSRLVRAEKMSSTLTATYKVKSNRQSRQISFDRVPVNVGVRGIPRWLGPP